MLIKVLTLVITQLSLIQRYEAPATDGDINGMECKVYEGINTIPNLQRFSLATASTELSDADKNVLLLKLAFWEVTSIFELKKIFNSVPYVDRNKVWNWYWEAFQKYSWFLG